MKEVTLPGRGSLADAWRGCKYLVLEWYTYVVFWVGVEWELRSWKSETAFLLVVRMEGEVV